MTRNPPQGQGYGGYGYGQGQQQSYGNYPPSGEQEGYGGGGYNPPQFSYGSNYDQQQSSAQGYYGSNEQAYQQYPPAAGHQSQGYQQAGYQEQPYGQQQQYQQAGYGEQPPYGQREQNSSYGNQPPPQHYTGESGGGEGYPQPPYPSNTEYPSAEHYQYQQTHGSGVEPFRSQYDQQPLGGPASQYPPPGASNAEEGDRGIMGALAGGAAGAWGGHKVNHGILGGIGGAVAGSMLEDAYKKHHKKEKEEEEKKKYESHHHHGGGGGGSAPVYAGNFHASSRNVYLEGHSTLVADCADPHGHHHRSTLDLNDCLTNTNGHISWARGGNFGASSRHIRLKHDGRVLEAELGDGQGGWRHNEIDLNEKITNDNGRLEMV